MRKVVTQADIPAAGEFKIESCSIVTPSARDIACERGVSLVEFAADQMDTSVPPARIGAHDQTPVDYPDIARPVAEIVARGAAARGVIIDGAGIGSAMVANKFPGIRAALCYDKAAARNSREHNDSNALTLGVRLLTANLAEDVLPVWLGTPFSAGRHAARIQKITEIEKAVKNWTPQS